MQMVTVPKQELILWLRVILVLLGSISYWPLLSVGPVLLRSCRSYTGHTSGMRVAGLIPPPTSLHVKVSLSDLLNPVCVISDAVTLNEPVVPSLEPGLLGDFSNTSS